MTECSACGAALKAHETRCPECGKPTAFYHRQRRCLHCGTPAAQKAVTCMMCGKPIDTLPLNSSIFSGSWIGVGLGILIIIGLVIGVTRYQGNSNAQANIDTPSPTATGKATPTATITATPTTTDTPMPTATFTPTPTPTPLVHIIKSGDNPSIIADLYGVNLDDLLKLNNITDVSTLQVGQVLLIPTGSKTGSSPSEETKPVDLVSYIIKSGDTLLGIALEYGTTVEAINAVNPDTSLDLIFPGQEIKVPLATPTPTATPTIPPTPTATPGPAYSTPNLLSPSPGQVVDDEVLLFNWTSTGLLAQDEFYVLQLNWANGEYHEIWLKNSGWRVTKAQRPENGFIKWTVSIMRQTGANPDGSPTGINLTLPAEQRTVEWR